MKKSPYLCTFSVLGLHFSLCQCGRPGTRTPPLNHPAPEQAAQLSTSDGSEHFMTCSDLDTKASFKDLFSVNLFLVTLVIFISRISLMLLDLINAFVLCSDITDFKICHLVFF